MNYIYLINEHYPLLTKSERKVADFILNSGESIIYSTMNDIKTNFECWRCNNHSLLSKTWIFWFFDLKLKLLKKILKKKEQPSSGKYHDEVAKV